MNNPTGITTRMGNLLPKTPQITAPELDESIVAKPLVAPEFANLEPANPEVSLRWIEFKAQDGFRLSQAQAQGWQVAKAIDVKNATKSPYLRDGGTKFVNGDLLLMKIARKDYLGALKHKHMVAAALSDPSILKTLSASKASGQLEAAGAGRRENVGKMQVFTPGGADLSKTPLATAEGAAEVARLGNEGPPDTGRGADIK